jgi:predicted transcriptional regulator
MRRRKGVAPEPYFLPVTSRVRPATVEVLDQICDQKEITRSTLVRQVLEAWVASQQEPAATS